MARRKAKPVLRPGDRIEMIANGTSWSGVVVPRGTFGTVYIHQRPSGNGWWCVAWDGFPLLQANGFPYGIGGDPSKDYVPLWARKVESKGGMPEATAANCRAAEGC